MDVYDIFINPVVVFLFTLYFVCLPRYICNYVSIKTITPYIRCVTSGLLLAILMFHLLKDLYIESVGNLAKFSCGISLLFLFAIDKLYIESFDNKFTNRSNNNKFKTLVYIAAMGIHSFLEGISLLVLTRNKKYYVISLFGHKWIEAMTLGFTITLSPFSYRFQFSMFVFYSLLTPMGEVLGYLVHGQFGKDNENIADIMTGLSCGSYFYIGLIDMLSSEFSDKDKISYKAKKIFSIFLGFLGMASFLYICPSD